MAAPYTAHCACGAVSATIEGEPLGIRLCWCRQCQQIAAGGPTSNAVFEVAGITMTGELRSHSFRAASGNTLTQYFCPECGTPIFGQSSAREHLASLRLGFLDEGHELKPDTNIWTEEAPPRAVFDPALARYDRQAPPPVVKD